MKKNIWNYEVASHKLPVIGQRIDYIDDVASFTRSGFYNFFIYIDVAVSVYCSRI